MLALASGVSSALQFYSIDDRLESQLGDVLLLVKGYKRTTIASAFTKTCYYTLLDDHDGASTLICRGNVMQGAVVEGSSCHIATVSVAKRLRKSTWMGSGSSWWGRGAKGKEKEKNNDEKYESEPEDEDVSEKGPFDVDSDGGESRKSEYVAGDKETDVTTSSTDLIQEKKTKQKEVLVIKFGDAASQSTRRSIVVNPATSKVTIHSKENGKYEWDILEDQPALFHCAGSKQRQVLWTRGSHISSTNGASSTFPGSLTVYPEIRPMLDSIMISLVGWQHLKTMN